MKETLIIAGFGGQGVLSMGKILAYSGVMQDYEVTWMPSHGPEMRGGTANVTVILSDRKISSPIAHEYDTAIILNQQSMEKFEPLVKPGGVLIYDTNGISRHPVRTDISVYSIDATAECAKMGQAKLFNTMILGGYLKVRPIVEMENVMIGLKKSLPERAWKMLPQNGAGCGGCRPPRGLPSGRSLSAGGCLPGFARPAWLRCEAGACSSASPGGRFPRPAWLFLSASGRNPSGTGGC